MKLCEYVEQDGLGLAELVRAGQVTPAELLDVACTALAEVNPRLNAVVEVFREDAEQEIARGLPDGPFRGVPFLVKDFGLGVRGRRTRMGSRLFASFVCPIDTELMGRYRRAGLVTFGKTNLPELALSFETEPLAHGPTRNPWNPERGPGGSSGGSAAAVAARIVPLAHANDGAGSIRVPAAATGLFGLKPTRARTPAGPLAGEPMFGLGVEHALTRTVRDSAALLDATAGEDAGAPYAAAPHAHPYLLEASAPPGRLRVAFDQTAGNGVEVDPECRQAVHGAAQLCEELGHDVVEARLPVDWGIFREAFYPQVFAFVAQLLDVGCRALGLVPGPENLELSTQAFAERGRRMSSSELVTALELRNRVSRTAGQFFQAFDVLLTPTLCSPARPFGSLGLNQPGLSAEEIFDRLFVAAPFTPVYNLTGSPAMSVPFGSTRDGLPLGVQFGARYGGEHVLLRLAGQIEAARPWAGRKPPIVAGGVSGGYCGPGR